MSEEDAESRYPDQDREGGRYPRTRWSLVLAAAGDDEQALNELFQLYWPPVYSAFYDRVRNFHDAEDLVQRFFFDVHRRRDLRKLDPQKGLFRSFLKAAIVNLYANYVDEVTAIKRGGRVEVVSIDQPTAEDWYGREPSHGEDPGILFDRRWVLNLCENAKRDLYYECRENGKSDQYEALEDFLIPDCAPPYPEIARRLNQEMGTTRVTTHRLRRRYKELIREHVIETVDGIEFAAEEFQLFGFDLTHGHQEAD